MKNASHRVDDSRRVAVTDSREGQVSLFGSVRAQLDDALSLYGEKAERMARPLNDD